MLSKLATDAQCRRPMELHSLKAGPLVLARAGLSTEQDTYITGPQLMADESIKSFPY